MADTTQTSEAKTTTVVVAPSTTHFWAGIIVLALAIVGGLLLHGWVANRKSTEQQVQQVNATAAVQTKQDDSKIQQAQQTQVQAQQTLAQQIALINAAKQQPVAPVDYDKIDKMIATHLQTDLVNVTTKTDDKTNTAETTVPTQAAKDFVLNADATQDQLQSCSTQLQAEQTKNLALTNKVTTQQTQIKATDQVLKGGTFKHRLWVGFKHGVCGAAGAGAGIFAGSHGSVGTGVTVGGMTYGGCEAFFSFKH